ncbi:glycosyltransferase family 2 protein [Bacillus sp. S10(2024)]|uniref:glycosyltransferase family 2 protein n=1 Tax=Bacillus sp. S10(2024) TaxID=3162886 RepID=UPI003D1D3034
MAQITVIIPTRDRLKDLYRCLKGLSDNNLQLLEEVIVIDDGSKIPITSLKEQFNFNLTLIRNDTPLGAAASRNLGSKFVKSEIIAFLDDDAIPSPDWLDIISKEMLVNRGGITGRVLGFDTDLVSKARQARYNKRYTSLKHSESVNFFSGGNSAVWTNSFLQVGGFTQKGSGGDNGLVLDLARLGFKIHFIPELLILHRNSKGMKTAIKEAYYSGIQSSKKIKYSELIYRIKNRDGAVGESKRVSSINFFLNLVHLFGRTQNNKVN